MKKISFARDLFSHTGWLPRGFVDQIEKKVEEIAEKQEVQKSQNLKELSRKEVLDSMKDFTDKVLEKNQVEKVVLDNVELSREKSQSNYVIESSDEKKSWEYLEQSWKDHPHRLGYLKSREKVKVLFVVHNYRDNTEQENSLSLVFEASQLELFSKMAGAIGIPSSEIAVSAVSGVELNWSSREALDNLHHEMNVLNPKYIVSFGAMATHALLHKKVRLSLVQGEFFDYTLGFQVGATRDKHFQLMPLFHPEYLLINPKMKRKTWEGMQKIMERL